MRALQQSKCCLQQTVPLSITATTASKYAELHEDETSRDATVSSTKNCGHCARAQPQQLGGINVMLEQVEDDPKSTSSYTINV